MKTVLGDDAHGVIRFDKGEEVVAGLQAFLESQGLSACAISAIGSCSSVELGFYNEHLKDYRKKVFLENLEIVSLSGTGGVLDGKPVLHLHGAFGRTDFSLIGGHVFQLVPAATCEVVLTKLPGALARALDPNWNLKLLS